MLQKHVRSAVKMSTAKGIMTEWNTMRTRAMSSWPALKAENNPNVLVDNQVVTGRTLYKDHFSMYRVLGRMTLTDRRWRHLVMFSMLDLIFPCFWGNFTPWSPLWATLIRLIWKSSEFWNCEECFPHAWQKNGTVMHVKTFLPSYPETGHALMDACVLSSLLFVWIERMENMKYMFGNITDYLIKQCVKLTVNVNLCNMTSKHYDIGRVINYSQWLFF